MQAVRDVVNANLPDGYVEGMHYGMIGWYVPLERYPHAYNGYPIGPAALASQKQYMSLYLVSVYSDPELEAWFRKAFADAGKKLDMGKSCVRFKTIDALPLDVIGQTIAKVPVDACIAQYEAARALASRAPSARTVRTMRTGAATTKKATTKKATKASTKKATKKTTKKATKKASTKKGSTNKASPKKPVANPATKTKRRK
jgi:hypothetical protein